MLWDACRGGLLGCRGVILFAHSLHPPQLSLTSSLLQKLSVRAGACPAAEHRPEPEAAPDTQPAVGGRLPRLAEKSHARAHFS